MYSVKHGIVFLIYVEDYLSFIHYLDVIIRSIKGTQEDKFYLAIEKYFFIFLEVDIFHNAKSVLRTKDMKECSD